MDFAVRQGVRATIFHTDIAWTDQRDLRPRETSRLARRLPQPRVDLGQDIRIDINEP